MSKQNDPRQPRLSKDEIEFKKKQIRDELLKKGIEFTSMEVGNELHYQQYDVVKTINEMCKLDYIPIQRQGGQRKGQVKLIFENVVSEDLNNQVDDQKQDTDLNKQMQRQQQQCKQQQTAPEQEPEAEPELEIVIEDPPPAKQQQFVANQKQIQQQQPNIVANQPAIQQQFQFPPPMNMGFGYNQQWQPQQAMVFNPLMSPQYTQSQQYPPNGYVFMAGNGQYYKVIYQPVNVSPGK